MAIFVLDGDSPASVCATHDELHLLAAGAEGAATIDARVPIRVVATAHHRPGAAAERSDRLGREVAIGALAQPAAVSVLHWSMAESQTWLRGTPWRASPHGVSHPHSWSITIVGHLSSSALELGACDAAPSCWAEIMAWQRAAAGGGDGG
jgi:hypothetical protein